MASKQRLYDQYGNLVSAPNKRSRVDHGISDSEWEQGSDDEYEESGSDFYRNPSAFLNQFTGYESDNEDAQFSDEEEQEDENDDEHDDDDEQSDDDVRPAKKPFKIPKLKKASPEGFDVLKLPAINNNGLKYLPQMRYFPMGEVCPLKPQNKVEGEALTVLTQLPNGGFHCFAIPFEAVEETDNKKATLRVIKAKAFLISAVLDKVKLDASSSGLGLDGFKELLGKKSLKDEEELDSDGERKPLPPSEAGYSQSKKKVRGDFDSKGRVIRQVLEEDPGDLSIDGLLARTTKIRSVAKKKKYKVPQHEATFLQDLFMPPIHKWDPAYKPAVLSLPIPFNSWVDEPPELNDYMLPALRKNANDSGKPGEPKTRWDHILVNWQKTVVHITAGMTPWLAEQLPDDASEVTNEMLQEWKKKQILAGIAAQGCNILFEEMGLRRRMNFYFEFKKSSEWKNLGFLKTVRMGKEILKKDISKAFNEVKATSRAYDKKVALNTNKNYSAMQATKPWASPDEVAAFNRGRGFGQSRGRALHLRGSPRSGNVGYPRNEGFSSGGQEYGYQNQKNNGNRGGGRGAFPHQNRGHRGQPSNHYNNQNGGHNGNNRGSGFPQKSKPQNRGFRGGGN